MLRMECFFLVSLYEILSCGQHDAFKCLDALDPAAFGRGRRALHRRHKLPHEDLDGGVGNRLATVGTRPV
jgi:hypothetical protein